MARARALPAPGSAVAWPDGAMPRGEFCALVRSAGERFYRDLPWRNLNDAYAVLVSEVMLQQTQVKRVLGKWEAFMRAFPTIDALASASASDVLAAWQGLGYNRRALALKRMADECSARHGGRIPSELDELLALPGVGPATAAGVTAFAFNRPAMYLETNVRTVFLHELFPDVEGVPDRELEPLVAATCPLGNPRAWYYALLDYGAHLKQTVPNPSRRSAHHTRQSTFEGSRRQKRAELVRIVLASEGGVRKEDALRRLNAFEAAHGRDAVDEELFCAIVGDLTGEGFFSSEGGVLRA